MHSPMVMHYSSMPNTFYQNMNVTQNSSMRNYNNVYEMSLPWNFMLITIQILCVR